MCVQVWNCWEVSVLHLNMYRKEFKYLNPNLKINPLAYRFRRKKKLIFLWSILIFIHVIRLRILFILHHKPTYNCSPSNSFTIIIKKWPLSLSDSCDYCHFSCPYTLYMSISFVPCKQFVSKTSHKRVAWKLMLW